MAEKKEIQFENIKNIGVVLNGEDMKAILDELNKSQKSMSDFLGKLDNRKQMLENKRKKDEQQTAESAADEVRETVSVSAEEPSIKTVKETDVSTQNEQKDSSAFAADCEAQNIDVKQESPVKQASEAVFEEKIDKKSESVISEKPVEEKPVEVKVEKVEKVESVKGSEQVSATEKNEKSVDKVEDRPQPKVEQTENKVKTENFVADKTERTNRKDDRGANQKRDGGREGGKFDKKPAFDKPRDNRNFDKSAVRPAKPDNSVTSKDETGAPKKPILPSFIVRKGTAKEIASTEKPKRKEYIPDYKDNKDNRVRTDRKPRPAGARPTDGKPTDKPNYRTYDNGSGKTSISKAAPMPAFTKEQPAKSFGNKKKSTEKNYDDKKNTISKRALIKSQISVRDFDEDKTGYRKLRIKKQKGIEEKQQIKIEKAIINSDIVPVKVLSEKLGISAVDITKRLFKEGIIKTINDTLDFDTAAFIAADLGIELELKQEMTAEEKLTENFSEDLDDDTTLVRRPPVVTVMGHVDHGKTSLLDRIRSSHVTEGEAGGITQHIGAYSVNVKGNAITFLDTPGHAAFTAMRARGAQVTDIAIIVIAADDGIMPQTIEAINHAKAAGVAIIIAANKIDKPTANLERIKQQLTEQEILVEDWGGDIILAPVSAKTGEGIDRLLETILLVADMRDLKANPNRKAKGAIIEAKLDKGQGPVATVLIQNGTLKIGDYIVSGTTTGKVRAMIDDKGKNVKQSGPSTAVSVLGFNDVPNAGDLIFAADEEKLSKLVAQERRNKEREDMIKQESKVSLDDLFSKIEEGKQLSLNIIIKADVQGSVEAVKQSLVKLSNDEVKVHVIHAAVGAISETDVMLADSSNSIIIGFNVRPDANAKAASERCKVDIKLYKIIYEAIDDVQNAMKGMLAPKFKDVYMGKAEVRNTFNITGVGTVAGCYVTEGKIVRNGKLRIYRNDVMICEGNVLQLKRFQDDVKEVQTSFECGISIQNFNDIKVGDFIECYVTEQE